MNSSAPNSAAQSVSPANILSPNLHRSRTEYLLHPGRTNLTDHACIELDTHPWWKITQNCNSCRHALVIKISALCLSAKAHTA
jgi:hypothetical protein